jgi:integrase/recombinase XerC/integrase/recombinase XerD
MFSNKPNLSKLKRAENFLKKIPDTIADKKFTFDFIESLDTPSAETVLGYSYDLYKFALFCSPNAFCSANKKLFRKYKNYLFQKGLTKNSIKRYLASLSSFYHFLVDENILKNFPLPRKLINQKTEHKTTQKILDEKMVISLLNAPDTLIPENEGYKKEMIYRDKSILQFLYKTGIRNSELRLLRIEDIDLTKRQAIINGKGRKIRTVMFDNQCKEIYTQYLSLRNDQDPIAFRSKKGGHISIMTLNRIFKKYLNIAKIEHSATPHMLRHTFASKMLEKGANIKFISEFLGHSSVKITLDVYSHISDSVKKSMYDSISL